MRKEMVTWKSEIEDHAAALSDLDRCVALQRSAARGAALRLLPDGCMRLAAPSIRRLQLTARTAPRFAYHTRREADDALEPLKAQLSDLEQQVKDREGMIQALKARAFENEQKIQVCTAGVPAGAPPRARAAVHAHHTMPHSFLRQRLLSGSNTQ